MGDDEDADLSGSSSGLDDDASDGYSRPDISGWAYR